MKKFIFSAVALTAFSFSTMANNEVKEEKVRDCEQYAIDVLTIVEAYSPCEISDEQGSVIMNHAYAECLGYTDSQIKN